MKQQSNIMSLFKKSYIKLLLILMIALVAHGIFKSMILTKIYYYLKNGQQMQLEHYQINLPFPEWVWVGQSGITYVLSAGKINDKDIFAEIAIDYRNVQLDYLLKSCDDIFGERKQFNYIQGTMYICRNKENHIMYFLSDNKYFFLRADPYFPDQDIKNSYINLLNSIEN